MNKIVHMVTYLLMFIGALNWGLVAFLRFNLVNLLFGNWPPVEQLVYIIIGAAAVYEFVMHKETCKLCGSKK
jgi:uncharacterized membrane protein YuzA (DUF378 family)